MRNTEFLSSLLGRSVTNETYLTINLEKNSNFRNLRIITFRKTLGDLQRINIDNTDDLISEIDKINKVKKINLIAINLEDKKRIKLDLERYLININKNQFLMWSSYFLTSLTLHLILFSNHPHYSCKNLTFV